MLPSTSMMANSPEQMAYEFYRIKIIRLINDVP